MLSPVFWFGLVAVFLGLRWLADGLMSVAAVEVRQVAAATETRAVAETVPPSRREVAAFLDKAA